MLKLINIKKDYKVADTKVPALKGVSLCFRENEFVGVLGQSGCGKTTLLNIIGGLDHYTEGDLVIEGKSTKDFKDRDWDVYRNHRIGFIFQSYNLIPHQTVLGNVELALTIAGISREERIERAKKALERVGLASEINKRPNQLSGGQMQRVAIARALVNNPAILLADEPTGALDSKTSVEVMDLIREIAGERLVIMVTHNPELAEEYANRIVRLKDGEVESDSNPYSEEEEAMEYANKVIAEEHAAEELAVEEAVKEGEPSQKAPAPAAEAAEETGKKKKAKKPRAKMGFFTALALSFRNLLTKKGRTILTAIGGSIGIISVCLVLALSNGFNHYIKKTEEDMLSYYPIKIKESTVDVESMMSSFTSPRDMPDLKEIGDRVYIDSFLTGLAGGLSVKNNVSEAYLDYIGKIDPSWMGAVQYDCGQKLAANLFTSVNTGDVDLPDEDGQYQHVDPETNYFSLQRLKEYYIQELEVYKPEYSGLVDYARFFANIVNKMPGTSKFDDEKYSKYVLSQYDVLGGPDAHFPKNENEAVIVISPTGSVTDLNFAQLGLLNEKKFLNLFDKGKEEEKRDEKGKKIYSDSSFVNFSEIIGKEYTLFFNDAIYHKNTTPEELASAKNYPFTYIDNGSRTADTFHAQAGEGFNLKVTAVLRLKDGLNYGCLSDGLNITEAAIDKYIAANMQSEIVDWIENNSKLPIPSGILNFFERPCAAAQFDTYYTDFEKSVETIKKYLGKKVDTSALDALIALYKDEQVTNSTEEVLRFLGAVDKPNYVGLYASDFDSKEKLLKYLDAWDAKCEAGEEYTYVNREGESVTVKLGEGDKIKYTDTVGLLMSMVQTILNAITYVLVAFTAISLVVSSVMIGIITYVSVVERVKEIGVLRSLGARKQDIRNLFNAETFIIGLTAGVFGVIVSYLFCFIINAILNPLTGITGLASLNPVAALIMICISVGLTLISGLIPASAAAKKDPVIALRTE